MDEAGGRRAPQPGLAGGPTRQPRRVVPPLRRRGAWLHLARGQRSGRVPRPGGSAPRRRAAPGGAHRRRTRRAGASRPGRRRRRRRGADAGRPGRPARRGRGPRRLGGRRGDRAVRRPGWAGWWAAAASLRVEARQRAGAADQFDTVLIDTVIASTKGAGLTAASAYARVIAAELAAARGDADAAERHLAAMENGL